MVHILLSIFKLLHNWDPSVATLFSWWILMKHANRMYICLFTGVLNAHHFEDCFAEVNKKLCEVCVKRLFCLFFECTNFKCPTKCCSSFDNVWQGFLAVSASNRSIEALWPFWKNIRVYWMGLGRVGIFLARIIKVDARRGEEMKKTLLNQFQPICMCFWVHNIRLAQVWLIGNLELLENLM